jgi:hypothetical protein
MWGMAAIFTWFGTDKNFIQNDHSSKLHISTLFSEKKTDETDALSQGMIIAKKVLE